MLSLSAYALGIAELLVVVGSAGVCAVVLRRALLPLSAGAPARLAEVVLAVALALVVSEALGAVGLFRPGFVVACLAVLAGGLVWWARRGPGRGSPAPAPAPAGLGRARVVALVAGGVVLAEWSSRTFAGLGHGMWNVDTLWYHAPHAARFVQDGWVTGLAPSFSYRLIPFYPDNAELLQALVNLPFHRDFVTPFFNLGALAIALLAGWCIGRTRGVAPAALMAVALALATPVFPLTQPGSAANDVFGTAFFLAAIALLMTAGAGAGSAAVAGLAAGIALGTKLVLIGPALLLTFPAAITAKPGRRLRATALWGAGLVATGGFWYARNLAEVGSPVPQLELGVGGVALPHVHFGPGERFFNQSLLHYVADAHKLPPAVGSALKLNFGGASPVVVLLAVAGIVAGLASPARRHLRLMALLAVACGLFYALTPQTAALFRYDIRYAAPALALGLVLLALWSAGGDWRRRGAQVVLAGALAAVIVSFEVRSGPGAGATARGVALAAAAALAFVLAARRRHLAVVALVVAVAAVGGWFAQRQYLSDRYAHGPAAGELDEHSPDVARLFAWSRRLRHVRIGVVGLNEAYPLYGADLSNRVDELRGGASLHPLAKLTTCTAWRAALRRGRYDYVVMAPDGYPVSGSKQPPPEARFVRDRRAATPVFSSGVVAAFRLADRSRTGGCAA